MQPNKGGFATRLQDQALGMAARVRQLVEENARVQRDQDEFKKDYETLLAEHAKLSEKIQFIAEQKKDTAERRRRIEIFLHMLEEQKECLDFESGVFVALVDKVIIQRDGDMEFQLKNGMKCAYPINASVLATVASSNYAFITNITLALQNGF